MPYNGFDPSEFIHSSAFLFPICFLMQKMQKQRRRITELEIATMSAVQVHIREGDSDVRLLQEA